MPSSNLRFVSQFFFRGGGRSIGSRRNFSSPPVKKDESLWKLLERNPLFFYSTAAGFLGGNISQSYRMLKVLMRYVEDDKKTHD